MKSSKTVKAKSGTSIQTVGNQKRAFVITADGGTMPKGVFDRETLLHIKALTETLNDPKTEI